RGDGPLGGESVAADLLRFGLRQELTAEARMRPVGLEAHPVTVGDGHDAERFRSLQRDCQRVGQTVRLLGIDGRRDRGHTAADAWQAAAALESQPFADPIERRCAHEPTRVGKSETQDRRTPDDARVDPAALDPGLAVHYELAARARLPGECPDFEEAAMLL